MRLNQLVVLGSSIILTFAAACACNGNRQTQSPSVEAAGTKSASDATQAFTGEGCERTGCSGHICAAAGASVVSTCIWKEEFACYKTARCEKQANGSCGWTQTDALSQCLSAAKSK